MGKKTLHGKVIRSPDQDWNYLFFPFFKILSLSQPSQSPSILNSAGIQQEHFFKNISSL